MASVSLRQVTLSADAKSADTLHILSHITSMPGKRPFGSAEKKFAKKNKIKSFGCSICESFGLWWKKNTKCKALAESNGNLL